MSTIDHATRPAEVHAGNRDRSHRSPGDERATGASLLAPTDGFVTRHIGPDRAEVHEMLAAIGYDSMDAFIRDVVPESIRSDEPLSLSLPAGEAPAGEHELLGVLREIASKNEVWRSCIGMGYYGTIVPGVIQRNILENPGWYTQYTPYQPEIAQGRLEALLNYQTMVSELTGLEIANASLLDEATAAAEAMTMAVNIASSKPHRFFIAEDCHPQTIGVVTTRGEALGIEIVVGKPEDIDSEAEGGFAGALLQYPATDGRIEDYEAIATKVRNAGGIVVCATDLLALCLLRPPGEWGADIAVGSAQRFGVPMGYGGPHAAFIATHQKHVRRLPGRLVGVSKDAQGSTALRLAIQTREQHIRRDRATSNICTAQVLLAVMAGMYGCYHGPTGLRRIASRVHAWTGVIAEALREAGNTIETELFFDTIRVRPAGGVDAVRRAAEAKRINLRYFGDGTVGISLDETIDRDLAADLVEIFGGAELDETEIAGRIETGYPEPFARATGYMAQPIFNVMDSESELLRYITKLQNRDLSLTHGMIPLGSCTMKLNGTSEMKPITWPEFGALHPYAPAGQAEGYAELFEQLETWLNEMTGFSVCSLQPNAGAQGEYAGLLAIKRYHDARGEKHRTVCIVPESAHGTNAASAVMAGMKVVAVRNAPSGAIDADDLRGKVEKHADELAALMITYPSTCGVFDDNIREICDLVHERGGQVYMDGANMNAQLGLCKPGEIGADVCHLNLHKTFCIPHGGGGPGMGPICAASHLAEFMPGDPADPASGAISAAPHGSASILPISWMYIALMGARGLTAASETAILAANYMAKRLEGAYDVLFVGAKGRVAHEFVIDCRPFRKDVGIEIDDIAKRLMDYGFHAPTMSWPVPGTLMIEPTESEPKPMLDAYCDALLAIREEIAKVERGEWDRENNPLKHAPHTAEMIAGDWNRPYPRELGVFPTPRTRDNKFWPPVGRVDNPYGDRNLVCSCEPLSALIE